MPSNPWYRRFPNDYRGDTVHLTLAQHGAYTLLLDFQYANELPIVAENATENERKTAVIKITSAHGKREIGEALWVLDHFFVPVDGGLWNPRAYQEIRKRQGAIERMSQAGKNGAAKRWGTPSPTPSPTPKGTPAKNRWGSAWGLDGTRARPDPDRSRSTHTPLPTSEVTSEGEPVDNSQPATPGLSPEQRAEAEAMNEQLEQRRRAAGVGDGPGLRAVADVLPAAVAKGAGDEKT